MVIEKTRMFSSEIVDLERGVIGRDAFVSDEIYQLELERIFARTWLLVGHESQVPKPNDFFVSRMGEESVILTRDRDGQIHVLLNTCRHRGMKVCRYDVGNTPVFSCPYHGWSFSTDGKLVSVPGELIGVPQFQTAYHGELKKEEWGLVPVPKMHNYKGLIWACWDENAPDFLDYMGDMRLYLDALLDHRDGREGGSEVFFGVLKWKMPCNWKLPAENFIGDSYHGISHRSVEMVGIGPGGEGQERHGFKSQARVRQSGIVSFPGRGHGAITGPPVVGGETQWPEFISPQGPLDNMPVVAEYFERLKEERRRRHEGEERPRPGNGTVFPNMSFHPWFPRSIVVWHPVGPYMTEAWRWFVVDADAPKEVKDLIRHYGMRFGGPVGMTEQDDMENWNYATYASKGTIARRYPYNYEMGKGHSTSPSNLRDALVSDNAITEENARTFYSRWAELMDMA